MSLNETQQIYETWKRAANILVVFKPDSNHDGVSSALALGGVLQKLGKKVEIIAPDWQVNSEIKFLPNIDSVKSKLEYLQKFLIEIDVKKTPIKELSYDIKNDKLQISLIPKLGTWNSNDVTSRNGDYRFDLICAIGLADLESLNSIFQNHTDFFYHTPIMNIDHDPANEHYGQINHVDINTTAVSEVLFELITKIDRHLIDEKIATCLLAGMIGKTRSFKTPNVTPKTLGIASELMALGGAREQIVNNLYRTRTVPILRLWGRALARLKHDTATKFVWTVLSNQDFINAGADNNKLSGVIDELVINAPEAKVALILYEAPGNEKTVVGLLHAEQPFSALELAKPFAGNGNRENITFTLKDKTIMEAEAFVTEAIKQRLQHLKI